MPLGDPLRGIIQLHEGENAMDHLYHARAALKLRYVPFNYPAIAYHVREGNRLINERLAREGYPALHSGPEYPMADA